MKKVCTKCGINKALEDYSIDVRHKDGKQSECKNCAIVRNKKYSKSDKGKLIRAEYKKSDRGKLANAKYDISGRGKLRKAKYNKTEKGKLVHIKSECKRRSKILNTINDLTVKESSIIIFVQGYKCIYPGCDKYFDEVIPTLDHIKPASKGGPLVKNNVQYLCRKHNSTKGVQEIDYRSTIHKQYIETMELICHNNLNNQYK